MTRDQMLDTLKSNRVDVVFRKKDGTERKMRCTLIESLLPAVDDMVKKRKVVRSADAVSVWDMEKRAWRSFRVDSVIAFDAV